MAVLRHPWKASTLALIVLLLAAALLVSRTVAGTPAAHGARLAPSGTVVPDAKGGGHGKVDADGDKDGVSKHPTPDGDSDDGA